jgi:hypothetical protein
MSDRNKLFISYSHEDTKWLNEIRSNLPSSKSRAWSQCATIR